jgi:uncharacterized membrane protein YtjA (UPF0391 family)
MNRNVTAVLAAVMLAGIGVICGLSAGVPPVALVVFVVVVLVLLPVKLIQRARRGK